MISSTLNKRQLRCLAAMAHSGEQVHQAHSDSAAWHITTRSNEVVRLSLTGGDVWMMVKLGLIVKRHDSREFTLPQQKLRLIDCARHLIQCVPVRQAA